MNYDTIKSYIEKGLISEQIHPENNDVRIFNYTPACQFSGHWDEITMNCRGFIMNISTGEKLSNSFPKFFNYEEHVQKGDKIPSETPVVYDKYDGSLGILYWMGNVPWIATRGSFTSDQAKWATEWFRNNIYVNDFWNRQVCYLFEIIYPENRIVVNYDFSGLVFIGARMIDNGDDVFSETYAPLLLGSRFMMRRAGKYDNIFQYSNAIEALKSLDSRNREGFVLFWPERNLRMKIKFDEYKRLHRIITGVSAISIWEDLKEGRAVNFENVPDEFFRWVDGVQKDLRAQFSKIWGEAQLAGQMVMGKQTRKEQAEWILKEKKHISGVIFSLADGNDKKAAQQVWQMVRPKGQKVFKLDDN